jgi:maltooligosyltrehalose trehalohydrolase
LSNLANLNRVKIGAALILTSPYIPMLFQGEEWGASTPFLYFVDFASEPELAQAVAKGRCEEFASFGWRSEDVPDPTKIDSFLQSKLKWIELQESEHAEMLAWHKSLIALRRRYSSLTNGRLDLTTTHYEDDKQLLQVHRSEVCILCNFSTDTHRHAVCDRNSQIVLSSTKDTCIKEDELSLPPVSVTILVQTKDTKATRLAHEVAHPQVIRRGRGYVQPNAQV